jgi:hypothetical protein
MYLGFKDAYDQADSNKALKMLGKTKEVYNSLSNRQKQNLVYAASDVATYGSVTMFVLLLKELIDEEKYPAWYRVVHKYLLTSLERSANDLLVLTNFEALTDNVNPLIQITFAKQVLENVGSLLFLSPFAEDPLETGFYHFSRVVAATRPIYDIMKEE